MNSMTRRKFLHDLGLATASLAGAATTGCRPDPYPSSDFYVMLQGPWLLSAADCKFLRALTIRQPGYRYDYIDPHPRARALKKTASPVFEAETGICLGTAKWLRLDLCSENNVELSKDKRRRLFDGMRDQSQGLFYTDAVKVPDLRESPESRLEIQLSYPQEIFAMGLQDGVDFKNLTYVQGQKIEQWPNTIVLRYTKWRRAAFSGEGFSAAPMARGQQQIHRKFTISYPQHNETQDLRVDGPGTREEAECCQAPSKKYSECCVEQGSKAQCCCADVDAEEQARQIEARRAAEVWKAVMNLAAFPHNEVPMPKYLPCTHGKPHTEPRAGGDGTIAPEELKCLPSAQDGTTLVLSAAGSAGVHGAA